MFFFLYTTDKKNISFLAKIHNTIESVKNYIKHTFIYTNHALSIHLTEGTTRNN